MGPAKRIFIRSIPPSPEHPVLLRGWVQRLRVLGKTTFLILKDCSGQTQCVAASEVLKDLRLKSEDTVEIEGRVRLDSRAPGGFEVSIISARVLNVADQNLPFTSSSDIQSVALESLIECCPLALRNPAVGNIFRVQAALLAAFRQFLKGQRFTEIITSKLVASGTEGGTDLFELTADASLSQGHGCGRFVGHSYLGITSRLPVRTKPLARRTLPRVKVQA
ncbi:MAG: OB-fold nucleic acid binding domain-containing protein [Candidatus Sulfotelmatobacter sp.]